MSRNRNERQPENPCDAPSQTPSEELSEEELATIAGGISQSPADTATARWDCFECFPKSWKASAAETDLDEDMLSAVKWFENKF